MKIFALILVAVLSKGTAITPSSGCGSSTSLEEGKLTWHASISVTGRDDDLGSKDRDFVYYVPQGAGTSTPLPLMLWAHGQYSHAMSEAKSSKFVDYDLVSLYPQGLDDSGGGGGDCGTGWNTGVQSHDPETCTANADACCYSSCQSVGACTAHDSSCGWATCFDDATFLQDMVETIASEVCVDLDAVFMSGGSNGGMLTHWAYQSLPGEFRAVMPVYGLPLQGHNMVPAENMNTSILLLHDRSDTVIPVDGGLADGWYYESADSVLTTWAALHECDSEATSVTTAFDGGSTNLACEEYLNCGTGPEHQVMKCMYDGHHGSWPDQGEALSWWFFNQSLLEFW